MLALGEARARAAMGDAPACERPIAEADAQFGRAGSTDDEPAFLGYFDESEFSAQVGSCYLDLGRPREADSYLSQTLRFAPRYEGARSAWPICACARARRVTMADDTRVAVVTGANRGLGLAMARGRAEQGLQAVLAGRSEYAVDRAVAELAKEAFSVSAISSTSRTRPACA